MRRINHPRDFLVSHGAPNGKVLIRALVGDNRTRQRDLVKLLGSDSA